MSKCDNASECGGRCKPGTGLHPFVYRESTTQNANLTIGLTNESYSGKRPSVEIRIDDCVVYHGAINPCVNADWYFLGTDVSRAFSHIVRVSWWEKDGKRIVEDKFTVSDKKCIQVIYRDSVTDGGNVTLNIVNRPYVY